MKSSLRWPLRVGGPILFVVGLVAAVATLPEWRLSNPLSPATAEETYQAFLDKTGYTLVDDIDTKLRLSRSFSDISVRDEAAETLGETGTEWLAERGLGFVVVASGMVRDEESGVERIMEISLDGAGDPISFEFMTSSLGGFLKPPATNVDIEAHRPLAENLLRDGEAFGDPSHAKFGAQRFAVFPVENTEPLESIVVTEPAGMLLVNRRLGSAESIEANMARRFSGSSLGVGLAKAGTRLIAFLLYLGLFVALLVRRNIDLRLGLIAGIAVVIVGLPSAFTGEGPTWLLYGSVAAVLGVSLWCVIVWSASESWLRAARPRSMETIDTLASLRPGPRAAKALADGAAMGAGFAGFILIVHATMAVTALASAKNHAIDLPVFKSTSPLSDAVLMTGAVLLCNAFARHFGGKSETAVALAGSLLLLYPYFALTPWWAGLLLTASAAVAFRWLLEQGGAAAVFTATLFVGILPAGAFAIRHVEWLGGTAAAATILVAIPAAFALTGAFQTAEIESTQITVPRFMRRMREQKRVEDEMGILAEMQLNMLPDAAPSIEGWDIAGHSTLANEVGGDLYDYLEDEDGDLWIAIGDVSGHGYPCAIAQAMTKAALTSLVAADRQPSELLGQIDRVLRRGGHARTFTSLALAKLNTNTGHVTVSNSGNPYPIHITSDGQTHEIELPSLPLGMGPKRTYTDVEIDLAPKDYLLLYSDGLVEVRNDREEELGFEKPTALVRMRRGQSADDMVKGLLKAWRDHLGDQEVQDDTTVVVVRRVGGN